MGVAAIKNKQERFGSRNLLRSPLIRALMAVAAVSIAQYVTATDIVVTLVIGKPIENSGVVDGSRQEND